MAPIKSRKSRPLASPQASKRRRPLVAKPLLPAYEPDNDLAREDIDRLLLEAARTRANRALSE